MKENNTVIAGLDIGTTSTIVAIGEFTEENNIQIIGHAKHNSKGMRRGGVVNIDAVLKCVTTTIEDAEQMAGQEVETVAISVGGQHIEGKNSHGLVPIESRGKTNHHEISKEDVARVMKAARAVAIPLDREILHVMAQQYIVDDTREIKNPIGMLGVRLEADVHIITCYVSTVQNMIKAVNRAGFRVSKVLFSNVVAADTALTKDEKDLGVLLIDLGGGTSTASVYQDNAPYYTTSVPIGGIEISTDLSIVLKSPFDAAEKLKCEYGSCQTFISEHSEPVLIPGMGGRPPLAVERSNIVEIIKPRVYELLQILHKRIQKSGYAFMIGGGAVLIGGGSLLPGIAEATQEVLGMSARIGQPGNYNIKNGYLSSDYSTAVGLVKHVANNYNFDILSHNKENNGGKTFFFMKKWLRNFFE